MQTVTADDGTSIAYETEGEGPTLVLLHGSTGSRRSWDALRPYLTDAFRVVVPDRRGRGDSGDADGYGLEREVADLGALLDEVGPATVVGHSFGGLVALAAAPDPLIDRLVLYEPAVLVGEHRETDLAARLRERLDAGDRRGAMRLFLEEAGGVPDVERVPWWPGEVAFDRAGTVVRESEAVEAYDLPDDPAVEAPTLLLTGERGPPHLRAGVDALAERLPERRVVELDGVGHVGIETAPERVAEAVQSFLRRVGAAP